MKTISTYFILFLNSLGALALLGAFLSPMVNPGRVPFFSYWGLIMPYILIVNIIFIIYWIVKARLFFLISLLTILISWSTIKTSFPYHQTQDSSKANGLRVMSYNVRVFDRYNWSEKKDNISQMLSFIKKEYADIICFQEFGSSSNGITERFILNALGDYPYCYIKYNNSRSSKHNQGLAILSKYPIINKGQMDNTWKHDAYTIFADIKVGDNKYRIINAYYAPIKMMNKYDIIKGMDSENYKDRITSAIHSIAQASEFHSEHSEQISDLIAASDYPVLLCTDMNSTPVSHSYHTISKQLDDSYLANGTGFGATYNGLYPFLRIDFIFHSPQVPLISYERKKVKYSDHYPVIAVFAQKK